MNEQKRLEEANRNLTKWFAKNIGFGRHVDQRDIEAFNKVREHIRLMRKSIYGCEDWTGYIKRFEGDRRLL